MEQVTDYEILDHGIESSQYWQGVGVAYSDYTNVATGIGNTPVEALDDCLEQVASGGVDVTILDAKIKTDYPPTEAQQKSICEDCEYYSVDNDMSEEKACEDCELHYFLSIRYNTK